MIVSFIIIYISIIIGIFIYINRKSIHEWDFLIWFDLVWLWYGIFQMLLCISSTLNRLQCMLNYYKIITISLNILIFIVIVKIKKSDEPSTDYYKIFIHIFKKLLIPPAVLIITTIQMKLPQKEMEIYLIKYSKNINDMNDSYKKLDKYKNTVIGNLSRMRIRRENDKIKIKGNSLLYKLQEISFNMSYSMKPLIQFEILNKKNIRITKILDIEEKDHDGISNIINNWKYSGLDSNYYKVEVAYMNIIEMQKMNASVTVEPDVTNKELLIK